MNKKKQKEEKYTEKEVMDAENTMGDLMCQCSDEIFEVISKYPLTGAMVYGVLESVKLTIANDIYTNYEKEPYICKGCQDTLTKEIKENPKRTKEAQAAMYG